MIMFMLTTLVVIASGIILYEMYLSKKNKETIQPFHYGGYRLFDGEDDYDEELNSRPANIRDI
jgi:hypothetical protein